MDLMQLFQQQMTGDVLEQITQKTDVQDKQQAQSAANNAFTTLMGAISKNAATEQGAKSLDNALEKDHDGSMLDNVMDLFGGNQQPQNNRAANGEGILKHVLGNKQQGVVQALSQANNMNPQATQKLLQNIAPMVMGMLGKAKRQNNMKASDIQNMLNKQDLPQNNQVSGIMSMLDQDGDGNIMDDVGDMLGGFFGNKK